MVERNLPFSEATDDVVDVDARFMMFLSRRPELLGPVYPAIENQQHRILEFICSIFQGLFSSDH